MSHSPNNSFYSFGVIKILDQDEGKVNQNRLTDHQVTILDRLLRLFRLNLPATYLHTDNGDITQQIKETSLGHGTDINLIYLMRISEDQEAQSTVMAIQFTGDTEGFP